jgi:pimeloyl-ACP methyl ester carboxylesterase
MSPSNTSPEACPPLLLWHDVRQEFLSQSRSAVVNSPVGSATIRIWGSGPPLYFLPGFASPSELYCLLIWLLRDAFRCITVEPAGSTLDDAAPPSCRRFSTMDDYAELLIAAVNDSGDETFSIFGADFGAAWGLAAANRIPDRVLRLILLQGFARRRLSFMERQMGWLCGFSRRTLSAFPFREAVQTQNHRRWFPPFDDTRWQYFLEASGRVRLAELSRRTWAVGRFDFCPHAGALPTPTLLIRTEGDDRLTRACVDELERLLPAVRCESLHSTGRLAYLTHPHRLAKLIRSFCTEPLAESVIPSA